MWFANFFIAGSITMVLPFLSLYIEELGNFTDAYVQTWSGWVFGVTFVTAFLFSPVWGKIGDRYGRKKILILSASGLAVSVFLMGFVTSVWQLFLLRMFMGIFTGFIPMSQALISTQTPKDIAGQVLGTLQTGSITGSLLGPMLGGWIADSIGYATTFQFVSITVGISAFLVLFGIKEQRVVQESEDEKSSYNSKEVILHIVRHPILLMVMIISLFVQVAHFSIQPILSLFVGDLHGPENLALFSGIAFSAAGLGNLLMAKRWGRIADRVGYIKIMIALLFMAGIVYFPAAFVTNIWQLVVLRFLLGVSIGGIIPVRTAYIRQEAPVAMQGEVLGYNTSLRFLGNIIGPAMGGMIAGAYGFSMVFFVTSALLIACGTVMSVVVKKKSHAMKEAPTY
ncbi:MFS transporter [Halobacillus sp. ACCC02827]|uniref:MFS transporter n=1 Tax=Bacillaceae TaxID=186817 RepID=UPI0002A4DD56|nr:MULTISPECIES: MFS transporter [Bacillaceae]ELK44553.1 multidrug resistance protein [Halobacillus sp. BAB-2008]QHT48311.1 multidrug efflux MFS transporter [Bacillus sp. SB49]WJE15549.1 MFS transporter [Halobacillus sp. ACCC02827]